LLPIANVAIIFSNWFPGMMLTGLSLQDLPGRFPGVIIKNSKGYKEVGFRTRPPNGGFLISELARLPAELVGNLTELVRLPAKLVWWF